jgi:two-component system nitrate/nitrite sensor histidine kinase NarX
LRAGFAESDLLQALNDGDQSVAVENVQADPRVPEAWSKRLQIKALLCVPIWMAADSPGYLLLFDRRALRKWQTNEIGLIESFVSRAAAALMNAQLHKQLEWAAAIQERQRIAANMHDGLGQTLSLLGLRVDRTTDLVATGSVRASIQELSRIRELIEQASYDVRRSIASLQETPRPRRSLQEQLRELLGQLPAEQRPSVRLTIQVQDPLLLPPEHEEQILPIAQEALLNAHYHAQAQQIALGLERQADRIEMTIRDDGKGFDPTRVQDNGEGHFGLSIMRARAARIGAELHVNSEPGRGTCVRLSWTQEDHRAQTRPAPLPALALEAEP